MVWRSSAKLRTPDLQYKALHSGQQVLLLPGSTEQSPRLGIIRQHLPRLCQSSHVFLMALICCAKTWGPKAPCGDHGARNTRVALFLCFFLILCTYLFLCRIFFQIFIFFQGFKFHFGLWFLSVEFCNGNTFLFGRLTALGLNTFSISPVKQKKSFANNNII